MIKDYVTYDELKLVTGFTDAMLNSLLREGLTYHELEVDVESDKRFRKPLREKLFNLREVERWICAHIF